MIIFEDTRQKPGKHDSKGVWFEAHGIKLVRHGLYVGDYAVLPAVSVDTKRDIAELCNCLDQAHVRFRNEAIKAQEAGIRLIILTENTEDVSSLDDFALWQESDADFYRRAHGKPQARRRLGGRFAKACRTMTQNYEVEFEFCKPEESARRICELLRLEVNNE